MRLIAAWVANSDFEPREGEFRQAQQGTQGVGFEVEERVTTEQRLQHNNKKLIILIGYIIARLADPCQEHNV